MAWITSHGPHFSELKTRVHLAKSRASHHTIRLSGVPKTRKRREERRMARVRNPNWWSREKTVAIIWFSSAFLFFLGFRMALQNSTPPESQQSTDSGSNVSTSDQRSVLYDKMAQDLDEKSPVFLQGGETSQSLSLSDIFTLKDGLVAPVLKAANPPVRANVLYLSPEFAEPISQAVRAIFLPYFDKVIWFQNTSLFHFSMFHASHHLEPVFATENEIEAEVSAVKAVAEVLCPLKIVLDRVVLTSTGVLLGCWQVISGTDPVTIRAKLRDALPRAPKKQLYDPVLLHTSFARLLGHPNVSSEATQRPFDQLQFFHELVAGINNRISGFKAVVSELWFVEELDVLALALNGRMKVRKFHLGCSGS
ncbi:uncharacterized protein LOC131231594 [Magnolia sinica]|uniref:uncharacterized protein LOC131231594 n=1 Tax=Magnolia sinica TaxID=86752 RepID=UPI00265A1490|nr:uncharacterized protein LOC131231594 [Magnolia sinica]